MFLTLALALLLPLVAQAMPEDQLESRYESEIWAFYQSKATSHFFQGAGDKRIHYVKILQDDIETEHGVVVLLPGRTESAFKYAEFVYDLFPYGLSFYILDHRGQGASDRVSETVGASHVEGFSHFREDLETLVFKELDPRHKRRFAVAHSMGANILSLFSIKHPEFFERSVLASPMLDIPTEPLPEILTYYLFKFFELIGKGESFVFGHVPYNPNEDYRGTHSDARFKVVKGKRDLYQDQWIGGVTFGFVNRCLEATWDMRNHSTNLTMPILMLQAGKDNVVHVEGQDVVCSNAKNCKMVPFPEAFHEILMESDDMRDIAMREIKEFLQLKRSETPAAN